jgi:hypothetical protein
MSEKVDYIIFFERAAEDNVDVRVKTAKGEEFVGFAFSVDDGYDDLGYLFGLPGGDIKFVFLKDIVSAERVDRVKKAV